MTTRRIVVVGQQARGSPDFLLNDLAGTSGRLDVLVRCVRAALLVSHGLRHDTVVYLVLLGEPRSPKTLRFDGATARFIRPEERSLATLAQYQQSVTTAQAQTGVTLQALSAASASNTSQSTQAQTSINNATAVNMPVALTALEETSTALQAAMKTFSTVQGLSLFSYL